MILKQNLSAHTVMHTQRRTQAFLLRSNLLVSIPLSILSPAPNGPEIINLFCTLLMSALCLPCCVFLSSPAWSFSLCKEMYIMLSIFCGNETSRDFCAVSEKGKRDENRTKITIISAGLVCVHISFCVYVWLHISANANG